MYAIYGILPNNHLRVWERFVLACRILCQPVISKEEILKADALIRELKNHDDDFVDDDRK